jgi:ADP-ribosylation factor-binding protein GGA
LKKRFQTKEPKVIALSLELLDVAMVKCGNPFHIQVGTKEFMNELVNMFKMKNLPREVSYSEKLMNFIIGSTKSAYSNSKVGY